MSHKIIIRTTEHRNLALEIISVLAFDPVSEIIIREYKKNRSLESNAKMWAVLTDIANQVEWHGTKLCKEEWKDVITAAVKRQKVVVGIDGGFVVIGAHTSKMSISEMSDVIECATAFGCQQGVRFTETRYD